ncbi:MAG: adenylate kinase [Muribaculaceae bacterium]|nr:adenylate kinase [Muribaculaceae bacterium]MDE5929921.1 adenylate kinase [Muribaculaceae bacterium]
MLNVIVFGAPGSGKGTQSEKLINQYGLHHISTGEVLREHISKGTELGKVADSYISKGQLIPDELMVKVLADVLDNNPGKTANGVIFDGFPRTIPQAKALKQMLAERHTRVNAVIGLEVDEDDLIGRMLRRGAESGRADDNIDTIKKRLDVYHNQTSPLREYYLQEGKYIAVDGNRGIDEIFSDIKSHLDKKLVK